MSFITEDFLLNNESSKLLYNSYAKDMPICDYHCHLPEKEILEDVQFESVFDIMLKGDHYKWRLMRNYGIDEQFITGKATKKEKFASFCEALESAYNNPLYHWSQLELKMYFDCELTINLANAESIWNECNAYILKNKVSPRSLIRQSNVKFIFTTNEIFDCLEVFKSIASSEDAFKVLPSFRADKIMNIESEFFMEYLNKLENCTHKISNFDDLEKAISERLQEFISVGCRASDIALEKVYPLSTKGNAKEVFDKKISGKAITETEIESYKSYLVEFLMQEFKANNINCQLHIGAMRNNNTKMFNALGLDSGYDSIATPFEIGNLAKLFDKLEQGNGLCPCVLFNLNENLNSQLMTLLGCFQSSERKCKIQYGPAWWFLDHIKGIEDNLHALSALGHIGANIGMLTDSRSFLSYARHDYFRRILCNFLGDLMEKGQMTNDINAVGETVKNISYNNAVRYFGL